MYYRYNSINDCCRNWRKDNNITMEEIADVCNTSWQNVASFEYGNTSSGKVIMAYVKKGMQILGYEDDLLVVRNKPKDFII